MLNYFVMTVLMLLGFLLMFIILLQRGRGGGLAGAFGGAGGQSALGTRAGDVFTRITVGLAIVWVLIAAGSGPLLRNTASNYDVDDAPETPAVTSGKKDTTAPPPPTAEGEAGTTEGTTPDLPGPLKFPGTDAKPEAEKPEAEKPEGTSPDAEKKPATEAPETDKEPADSKDANPKSEPDSDKQE